MPNSVDGKDTALHVASPTSAYAKEVARLEKSARRLPREVPGSKHARQHGSKAILLDVDDTSLNTYNYEIYSNFAYNPSTNGAFVDAPRSRPCSGCRTSPRRPRRPATRCSS